MLLGRYNCLHNIESNTICGLQHSTNFMYINTRTQALPKQPQHC